MKIKEALEVLGEPYNAGYHSVKAWACFLDDVVGCPCCCCDFGIGLDPIIGLIPVVGDIVGLICALIMVCMCIPLGVSACDLIWMVVNVVIDFLIGEIILVGDVLDFFFQANERNCTILEKSLIKRAKASQQELSTVV
eukprot:TRINITY_DN13848_c0_g1_i1.p2 TRINITY_DN13848_c0_g1~~TRINITY_DN13848_c0_g1_i1.p2  ORF type:complete len:138 (+),score=42.12 TRINITY_DN13848_c0_g1_i1:198-611(+)